MSKRKDLKANYFQKISSNPSVLDWLTRDTFCGFWILNKSFPVNLWVNDAFFKELNYSLDNEEYIGENSPFIRSHTVKETIQSLLERADDEKSEVEATINFEKKSGGTISLLATCKNISSLSDDELFIIKFQEASEKPADENILKEKQREFKNLQTVYHETNELAKVGGWEVDLVKNKVTWTKVTKDIHEVSQDYEPALSEGINFYSEGWSRDTITELFNNAISNGTPFDSELKIVTANNREIWVRSFGKPEFKDGQCVRVYGAFQDIDAEKRNQLKYERTREQYEMIFKNSAVGNILVKTSGELLQINPATLRIFGYEDAKKEDVMQLTFKDLIHPDFLEDAVSHRTRLISGELDTYQLESKFYNRNGEVIWCRTNSSIIRSNGLGESLIITQVEDITEKKELEFRASENAKRFKTAFEYSPIGMGVVTPDGEWQMVNQNLASIFGYTKEEFMNKKSSELTHHEDLRKDTAQLKSLFKKEIDTYSVEKRFIHKNGKTVYGLLSVSAVTDDNGIPIYLIGQISDLTKRIQSERALQKSLNELQSLMDATTHVSIIQTDLNGVVSKFNKGAENMLGYSEEQVKNVLNVGRIHEVHEVEQRGDELTAKYKQEIRGFDVFTFQARRGHYDSREWTYIRKDGSKFPVQLVVTAITNHKGRITGYLGVATDISKLKKMEVSLIKAKKKAEAASKSKSEFLANMSHEIRTPLNGIIGFTDLLMRSELENSQQKYMQTIYNSANSLLDIINDVLDFSKIEAGKLELSEERTDLIELCDQTIDIVKHQAHKKGLEVLLNISPSLRRYVYADAVRLRQILTNLLGNSVKFTHEGEIELNISSKAISGNQHELIFTFSIRDTGIGIAPENLKKIFYAFDQEDASTTRKYGGSGLGLTISNKLLNLMDSRLELKSVLNEGSTFSFKVKLKTDEEVTYESSAPKNIKNVLIVDDNTNNRIILREMLAPNQIKCVECANGIEALNVLTKGDQNFDLAIIDYNMPYMNGISLIDQVRNKLNIDAEKLPVILLHSSTEDEEIINACRELKVHYHLTKPIQIHTLYNMIDSMEKPTSFENRSNEGIEDSVNFSEVYNILIVEDNPVNKFLANSIIKKILPNANLIQAENGEEAVSQFQANKLDLIFMDIQMPVMSGFEATEEIRKLEEENSYIPIIALTARAVKDERIRCIEAGMNDYLPKPVILEDIKEMMIKYLNITAN
ncbi:PAS domain S-box protein [Gramella sp. MAR_2010_147]|uniref:PAS domain-containing hybrid sensor histidine kinase/response regulator n=1 Tax=Gramella sp. MAR_2010_147 TaxID=1250205 RepID=UPI0008798EC5|nr:PAS domain S-box protein [Gramella sp. MAR_2010_147]SDR76882.1 PAS/PAC sensor hybrid histidine kinase [Gramella sp. MAR_2010_147]